MKKLGFFVLMGLVWNCCFPQNRSVTVLKAGDSSIIKNVTITLDFTPQGSKLVGSPNEKGVYEFNQTGAFSLVIEGLNDADTIIGFSKTYTGLDNHIVVLMQTIDTRIDKTTVTVFGSGARPITKTPEKIRIISRERIDKLGAQTLSDVLQYEPNINLGQDQILGSSVVMQGIGGQGIKILVNGIPVIGRLNGNIDVSQIPLNNVDRIEIIEGPMSVIYGSDALGGVINIITKQPVVQKKFVGNLNTFIDNINNVNIDLSVQSRLGKSLPINISAGRYFFGGVDFTDSSRELDWKPKIKYFADATVFKSFKNQMHTFRSAYFNETLIDFSNIEQTLTSISGYNHFYTTNRIDNQLYNLFQIPKKQVRIEFQSGFNLYKRVKQTFKRNMITGEETPYQIQDQDTTNFNFLMSRGIINHKRLSKKANYTLGYDYNKETGNGKRIPTNNNGISEIAGMAIAEFNPNTDLLLRPSVRWLKNNMFGSAFIPSAQLKYKLSEHLSFRGQYAKGFRSPSLKELYFNFVDINHNVHGNSNLQPEKSGNLNLSLDYHHKISDSINTAFGFAVFNNVIQNKIILAAVDLSTNHYTYLNLGRSNAQGLSLNFDFNKKNMNINIMGSLITVADVLKDTGDKQNYFLGQLGANVSIFDSKLKCTYNINSRYTGPTVGYLESETRYTIDPYYLVDFTAQKSLIIKKSNRIDFTVGIKNILGITRINSTLTNNVNPHGGGGLNTLITPGRQIFIKTSIFLQ